MDESILNIAAYSAKDYEAAIEPVLEQLVQFSALPIPEKIVMISDYFLDAEYVSGALGEGLDARFDQNPLFRHDRFDCLTFVNTVLAILFSENLSDFQTNLLNLNYYEGVALYQNRFHFMSTDWNIENARQGFIRDITADLLKRHDGSAPEVARTLIDKPSWFLKRTYSDIKQVKKLDENAAKGLLKELHGLSDKFEAKRGEVNYIPLKKLFNEERRANLPLFAKILPGSIIEIVRPNWPLRDKIGTNLNVSHVGFALYFNNDLIFRHASTRSKRVIDEPLIDYLREKCLGSSTIEGINVQQILEPV